MKNTYKLTLVKKILIFLCLFVLVGGCNSYAALLRSEDFEGSETLTWWDLDSQEWIDITNFVSTDFSNYYEDAKGHANCITKDTSIYHGGSASIRLYDPSSRGETAEFWCASFTGQTEIWMSWWERLSSNYEFNSNHKFILYQSQPSGNDPYINWQGSAGDQSSTFGYRVYASVPYECNGGIFNTGSVTLPTEEWYQWKAQIKFNTIGQSNGVFRTWVDQGSGFQLVSNEVNIEVICGSSYDMIAVRFGGTREPASGPGSIGQRWIDDILIGTEEVDVATSIGAALTGTLADGATEAQIVAGGQTLIGTITNDTLVATFGADNQITTDFIAGLDSGGTEPAGWDAIVKAGLTHANVSRDSATQFTVTLPAFGSYSITTNETITLTIPSSSLTDSDSPVVATPTFEITATSDPAATLTGTLSDNATEAQIVAGGETLVITLTNDTWVAAGGTFDGVRQDIIDGMDSAQSETTGWNNEVRDKEVVGAVVRTNATTVTITLSGQAAYDISANENITMTVPASALVTSGSPVVATPGFAIIFFDTSTEEIVGMTLQ